MRPAFQWPAKILFFARSPATGARGRALAAALRDGGFEVVYLDGWPGALSAADLALEEDARAVCVTGGREVEDLAEALAILGLADVVVEAVDPDTDGDRLAEGLRRRLAETEAGDG